jgi:hypothetical protein
MSLSILPSEQLAHVIERIVVNKQMSYLDAVLHFCERRNIEPEMIAHLLSDKIKGELSQEAQGLHFIPRTNRLPL